MVTQATRAQLQRVDDPSGMLELLVLEHSSMAPIYLVNDTRNWTISGTAYNGVPFTLKLPSHNGSEPPIARLELDNVGADLVADLEALPVGEPLTATIRCVSRARPDQVDFEFVSPLTGVGITTTTVVAAIGGADVLQAPAVKLRFDPANSPGLFPG